MLEFNRNTLNVRTYHDKLQDGFYPSVKMIIHTKTWVTVSSTNIPEKMLTRLAPKTTTTTRVGTTQGEDYQQTSRSWMCLKTPSSAKLYKNSAN